MKSRLDLLKALIWLHGLRLSRYKYSFVNYMLIDIMWYLIFLLGALMFIPGEEYTTMAIVTFWGIILWTIMNNSIWLIAGWTWFVLSMGLAEEHIIHNVNPLVFIAGRFLTGMSISLAMIPLVLAIFANIVGTEVFTCFSLPCLILGIILMFLYATLYALILAALSLRIHVPGPMLDILNIFMYIGGGLGVPVSRMPEPLRIFAILMPYTHAAEITRYGVLGMEPYLGLASEIMISLAYLMGMVIATIAIIRYVMKYIRIYGVRAVGMM